MQRRSFQFSLRALLVTVMLVGLSYPLATWMLQRPGIERYDLYLSRTKVNEQVTPERAEQAFAVVMRKHGLVHDLERDLFTEYLKLSPSSERGSHFVVLTSDTNYQGLLPQSTRPVMVSGSRIPIESEGFRNASERSWVSFYSIGRYWIWEHEGKPSTELIRFAQELKPELIAAVLSLDDGSSDDSEQQ